MATGFGFHLLVGNRLAGTTPVGGTEVGVGVPYLAGTTQAGALHTAPTGGVVARGYPVGGTTGGFTAEVGAM